MRLFSKFFVAYHDILMYSVEFFLFSELLLYFLLYLNHRFTFMFRRSSPNSSDQLLVKKSSAIVDGNTTSAFDSSSEDQSDSNKNQICEKENISDSRKSKRLSDRVSSPGISKKKADSLSNSLSIDMLNVKIMKKFAFDKLGSPPERKSKRLSDRRASVESLKKEAITSSMANTPTKKSNINAVTAEDVARVIEGPTFVGSAKRRRMSEPSKGSENVKPGKKKLKSRKSLPASSKPNSSSKTSSKSPQHSRKVEDSGTGAPHDSSTMNSSDSTDILNNGMITGLLDATESTEISSFDASASEQKCSSTRSSLDNSRFGSSKKNMSQSKVESVPNISLTPTDTPSNQADPYDFPDDEENEKLKKYRRRSSGSSELSRKQTLLLFGSPRTKEVTPLRRSIGRLRKNSEPLVEEPSPSPSLKKKVYDPLPYVEETENSSSPMKKPPKVLRTERASAVSKKLNRVSFGPNLSPEQFLKSLPPNTPVKKGATPISSRRKSAVVTMPAVVESQEKTFKTPPFRSASQQAKKVDRTPTPFKPDAKKMKGKPLLRQVLSATVPADNR